MVIATATLAILSRRPWCSRVLCLLYCLSHFGQVCRYVDHGFHVICALGQVCCNVPYVFCSACALMYMYRGLNTCVNILSVTVPFSCFPLTAVVFPKLLPWIIALWRSPNCYPGSFLYVQDHSVLYMSRTTVFSVQCYRPGLPSCEIFVLFAWSVVCASSSSLPSKKSASMT